MVAATSTLRFAIILVGISSCLSGCASTASRPPENDQAQTEAKANGADFRHALLQPVEDLNLKRTAIPDILLQLKGVYAHPLTDCVQIDAEVEALTEVLGPDVAGRADSSLAEQATEVSIDAVAGLTGSLIPFRGLVRRATGASAHEQKIRAVYEIGLQRRAFLNGVRRTLSCQ